jgi:hypothetical protein
MIGQTTDSGFMFTEVESKRLALGFLVGQLVTVGMLGIEEHEVQMALLILDCVSAHLPHSGMEAEHVSLTFSLVEEAFLADTRSRIKQKIPIRDEFMMPQNWLSESRQDVGTQKKRSMPVGGGVRHPATRYVEDLEDVEHDSKSRMLEPFCKCKCSGCERAGHSRRASRCDSEVESDEELVADDGSENSAKVTRGANPSPNRLSDGRMGVRQ